MKRVYVPAETTQAALVNSLARKAWRSGNPLGIRFRVSRVATFIDPETGNQLKAVVEGEMFLSKIWDPSIYPPPVISATIVPES